MLQKGIGLIGCGAMGSALVKGIVRKGETRPETIFVYDINEERKDSLAREIGVKSAADLAEQALSCRYIFIAVKPQDVEGLLVLLKPLVCPDQIITSIAAGITIKVMEEALPPGSKVIRMMPNTPCLLGEGAIAFSLGAAVTAEEGAEVDELIRPLGLTIRVPEKLMDAVTGLSGTGPAYVYLFAETLIDAGVTVGLRRDVAAKLVIQTMLGAARMLQESPRLHPAELRNNVTSPAGTTCAALQVLEATGFRSAMIRAVIEASRRSGELREDFPWG